MTTKRPLEIPQIIQNQVNSHLIAVLPEEGCGFLIGKNGRATEFSPIENELHSPVAYRMNPSEQIKAMINAEERNLEILAIVHSHPRGAAQPSITDMREASWPDICYVIVGLQNVGLHDQNRPIWRGWHLNSEKYEEIPLFVKK